MTSEIQKIYHECLTQNGLTPAQVESPEQLSKEDRANLAWVQQYTLDLVHQTNRNPTHWHPAFRQERMTKEDWDRAWDAPIGPEHLHKVIGRSR